MSARLRIRLALVSSLLAFTSGCDSATAPSRTPLEAAGVYVLVSVSGRGPQSGSFVLTADGRAERRVRFPALGPSEYIAAGTFALDATGIDFSLREWISSSSFEWPLRGEWRDRSSFLVRYPDSADGPDIVETYRRR